MTLILHTAVILLLTGCIKEAPGSDTDMAVDYEIDFEFAMPQYADEVLGTRATAPGTAAELQIWDAHLLVFRTNSRVHYESLNTTKISGNGTALPKCRSYFDYKPGDHIVVLLNTGYTTNFPYGSITNVSDINTVTTCSKWQISDTSPKIPMCGEQTLPNDFTLAAGAGKAKVTIPVYRSVSRFGVKQADGLLLDGKSWKILDFGFVNVPRAYYDDATPAAQHNYIAPASELPTLKGTPTAQWFVNEGQKDVSTYHYFPAFPASLYAQIYTVNVTTYDVLRAHAVIRASWDGKDNYYRIELAKQIGTGVGDDLRHGEWFDFKKNTSYTIQVNAVNGPGYPTLEKASDNPGKNIVYDVLVDDAYSNFVTSNGQYAIGVSRREAYVPGNATDLDVAYVRYISPINVTGLENKMKVKEGSVKPAGSTITLSHDFLTSTSVMLKAVVDSNFEEAVVEVTFGDLKEYITIRSGTYLEVGVDVPDWGPGGGADVGVDD